VRSPIVEWSVARKMTASKTDQVGFRVTPEEKRAIETFAVELQADVTELVKAAIVQFYESLGSGVTPKFLRMASDPAIWREVTAKAKERCQHERQSVRGRQ
jgi:hypothetical protein